MSGIIKGRCVACGFADSLFVSESGFITCSRDKCRDPGAVDDVLRTVRSGESARRVNALKIVAGLDYLGVESLYVDVILKDRHEVSDE